MQFKSKGTKIDGLSFFKGPLQKKQNKHKQKSTKKENTMKWFVSNVPTTIQLSNSLNNYIFNFDYKTLRMFLYSKSTSSCYGLWFLVIFLGLKSIDPIHIKLNFKTAQSCTCVYVHMFNYWNLDFVFDLKNLPPTLHTFLKELNNRPSLTAKLASNSQASKLSKYTQPTNKWL